MQEKMNENGPSQQEKEDFWLELGPSSAYYGLDSYDTAVENGDASPDGKLLDWEGAEPGMGAQSFAAPPDEAEPVVMENPELHALEWLDDVPPEDR